MDQRTAIERKLWDVVGPPLYYCSDCMRAVKVEACDGQEPLIERPCKQDCGHGIIAPRKAVAVGQGGASMGTKVKVAWNQTKAALTGRYA